VYHRGSFEIERQVYHEHHESRCRQRRGRDRKRAPLTKRHRCRDARDGRHQQRFAGAQPSCLTGPHMPNPRVRFVAIDHLAEGQSQMIAKRDADHSARVWPTPARR